MARKSEARTPHGGRLRRAANAVKRIFTRSGEANTAEPEATAKAAQPRRPQQTQSQSLRGARREADIPLDVLEHAYTPPVTSSKASFRSDGADHQHDQEYGRGISDDRWNDEDRFTNKSGDPRIGTHRRTYEPGEDRIESRD